MLATLVNASTNAVQEFAVIVFVIAGIIAFKGKTLWATLVCAGPAFLSAVVPTSPGGIADAPIAAVF